MKLTQLARECTKTKKEADVESCACGQEKFGNYELCRSSGADEERVRSERRWATAFVSVKTNPHLPTLFLSPSRFWYNMSDCVSKRKIFEHKFLSLYLRTCSCQLTSSRRAVSSFWMVSEFYRVNPSARTSSAPFMCFAWKHRPLLSSNIPSSLMSLPARTAYSSPLHSCTHCTTDILSPLLSIDFLSLSGPVPLH